MVEDWLDRLREIRETPWSPVTPLKLGLALGAVAGMLALRATGSEGWVPFLDGINLVFHEAGHPIFAILGDTIGFLGGTFMQLLVPLGVTAALWGKRQAVATALAGVWCFENGLNIARYMADARAQLLPLVGGGEHDWGTLLGRWGLLKQDTTLAQGLTVISYLGIAACCAWLAWRCYRQATDR